MKWEYNFIFREYRTKGFAEEYMDELGKEGWELVAVTSDPNGDRHFYLKRPRTI